MVWPFLNGFLMAFKWFFNGFLMVFFNGRFYGSLIVASRTTTVDKKKLQFLRNEYTHKKEEQAATYDVVGARPSCI